jgi:deoxyhypusine synthase
LSGSTYTEAVSWGKFVPPEEGGKFAEVLEDATVALPLVVGAVLERLGYFKR